MPKSKPRGLRDMTGEDLKKTKVAKAKGRTTENNQSVWREVITKLPKSSQDRLKNIGDRQTGYPSLVSTEDGLKMDYKGCEKAGLLAVISTLGVESHEYALLQLDWLNRTTVVEGEDPSKTANRGSANFAAIGSIAPNDAVESMLAVQMVAIHQAAMKALAQLNLCEFLDESKDYMNRATKLMNVYTRQIETLNKYRGKGQQKMTVEHVYVGEGGQAIIGNVEKGGGNAKKGGQPHALRSED